MTVIKKFRSAIHGRDFWRIVARWTDRQGIRFFIEEAETPDRWSVADPSHITLSAAAEEVRKRALVQAVNVCDGYEVHREQWPIFERLLNEKRISSLSSPRGPNGDWRRAEPLEFEE